MLNLPALQWLNRNQLQPTTANTPNASPVLPMQVTSVAYCAATFQCAASPPPSMRQALPSVCVRWQWVNLHAATASRCRHSIHTSVHRHAGWWNAFKRSVNLKEHAKQQRQQPAPRQQQPPTSLAQALKNAQASKPSASGKQSSLLHNTLDNNTPSFTIDTSAMLGGGGGSANPARTASHSQQSAAWFAKHKEPATPLVHELRQRIRIRGPMTLSEYMSECLTHPVYGYYTAKDNVLTTAHAKAAPAAATRGAATGATPPATSSASAASSSATVSPSTATAASELQGDFVTSPELSQVYGELLCIWFLSLWLHLGQSSHVQLIELGSGSGALLNDFLRTAKQFPKFYAALNLHLVEVSPLMRQKQRATLGIAVENTQYIPSIDQQLQAFNQSNVKLDLSTKGEEQKLSSELKKLSMRKLNAGDIETPDYIPDSGVTSDGLRVNWYYSLEDVPHNYNPTVAEGIEAQPTSATPSTSTPQHPTFLLAHEFFDALPIHRFEYSQQYGWIEHMVDIDETKESKEYFRLTRSTRPSPASHMIFGRGERNAPAASTPSAAMSGFQSSLMKSAAVTQSPNKAAPNKSIIPADIQPNVGDTMEVSLVAMKVAEEIAYRVGASGGAALVIDYGRDGAMPNSLQAVQHHKYQSVFSTPGQADLTAHVDFAALRAACQRTLTQFKVDAVTQPLITQHTFLREMGIAARLQQLVDNASTEEQAQNLLTAAQRLVALDEMGELFKFFAITGSQLQDVPVFSTSSAQSGQQQTSSASNADVKSTHSASAM